MTRALQVDSLLSPAGLCPVGGDTGDVSVLHPGALFPQGLSAMAAGNAPSMCPKQVQLNWSLKCS